MFRPGGMGGGGGRLRWIVERFKEKGATSADKAMTIEELGLPPRFEQAMHRRLGATGIFVEVNGKYYLDEAKLQQVQQQRRATGGGWGGGMGGGGGPRGTMMTVRMARMAVGFGAILLAVTNILFVHSIDLSLVVLTLLVLWLALTVYQMIYFSRMRRRQTTQGMGGSTISP
jgi:hypothetical protein